MNWTWKIGVLNGIGECLWQEMSGKLRRITRIAIGPQGIGFLRTFIGALSSDHDPQFDTDELVVLSRDLKKEVADDLDRVWSGSNIVMPNGGMKMPRLKLEP